ncbi:hypothetical protein BST81_04555 [Leptolyngbya sp. 'hensonii']|uniref:hypothetical protein n=1 Tax=Leptolyngbya sp. 'hensonii' TaxID=1922337 RepID=UPI00094F7F49|nr:hypothetical protein [Leptolyngbya sp. 'hensonii']OLP19546.1 hypothetical protein BST81_04555 [Leptolyngbya sp. 'hensonii']
MGFIARLIGLGLVLIAIYFLGQNIIFTTQTAAYWWRPVSATGSVLAILAGIIVLTSSRYVHWLGWALIGLGIALVFFSGSVILRPTSLWTFFLSSLSFASGYQLLTKGKIDL